MASIRTNYANAFETELTSSMGPTDLEATVLTTSGGPSSPCYLVIDPDDPAKREYIFFDGTFDATTFRTTGAGNRYLSGSADSSGITHDEGAVVRMSPVRQHFDDIHDRIEGRAPTNHGHDASDVSGVAEETHSHTQSDLPTIDVSGGGTGRTALTSGRYLRGAGTSEVDLATSATVASDLGVPAKVERGGDEMEGDLALHSYRERRSNTGTDASITVDFAGEALVWSTAIESSELSIQWSNIPSQTDRVRSVTIRVETSDVTWPVSTILADGIPEELSLPAFFTAMATGGEVYVFLAGEGMSS